MSTTPAVTLRRRRHVLALIVLGLASSAAGLLLPHTPGLLGNISRTMFGAAAGSAFLAAAVLAVLLSLKDTPEPARDPVPADEPAPVH